MPTPKPRTFKTLDAEPAPPQAQLPDYLRALKETSPYQPVGFVERVVGLTIESKGPQGRLGDVCQIETGIKRQPMMQAEIVGFRDGRLLLMPLGEMLPLSPGCRVRNTGHPFRVAVGSDLLGRILDPLGQPLDDRYELAKNTFYRIQGRPPHPLRRQEISEVVSLGIRAIDGFLTLGKGQRVGIFAGSGVGKSTTLGMIARNTQADVSVIALIGERGREVQDFIENSLGEEGLRRSVVIVATSDQPALLKIKAGLVAATVAEYFREQGKNVLLMMDSITRIAMALREVGLAVGEPPATRGYTPSVFAFMPQLLERVGNSANGTMTGLFTVLVEGDDMNEPIADLTRGILDGHIVLNRSLADQNHFPAIDVLASISRLMPQLISPEHKQAAGKLRDLMSQYKKAEDLLSIGAYVPGSNPALDRAIQIKPQLDALLRQDIEEECPLEVTIERLLRIAG